jgi:ribulose-phosphate 3-epimerase
VDRIAASFKGARGRAALMPYLMAGFPDIETSVRIATAYAEAGADLITVHAEAGPHLHRTIQAVKGLGKKAGVALNPATPVEAVDYILDDVDVIMVMSVNPGFGGQSFIDSQLRKIAALRARIDATGRDIALEVDGGIGPQNIDKAIAAGANVLVAGTSTFKGGPDHYAANVAALREAR